MNINTEWEMWSFSRSLFVLLYGFVWPLYCLSFLVTVFVYCCIIYKLYIQKAYLQCCSCTNLVARSALR